MVCVRGWVLKIDRIRGETSREGVGANVRNRAERRRSKRRKREREREWRRKFAKENECQFPEPEIQCLSFIDSNNP